MGDHGCSGGNPGASARPPAHTAQPSGKSAVSERGIFWADWSRRVPGEQRSLERAEDLAAELGLLDPGRPVLTVVGSKGKGTAATYASAYLVAAGLTVVTVTSPGLRGVHDRIRYNGLAISEKDLTKLARQVSRARAKLSSYEPGTGYLSPSGLFIITGVLYSIDKKADVIVLEAGMGGASDEVSLFSPTVVAIAQIFDEHIGQLGDTPAEIAQDKAGVITVNTSIAVSLPQEKLVEGALNRTASVRSNEKVGIEFIEREISGIPASLLAPSLGRQNSELGCVAAQRMLEVRNHRAPSSDSLSKVLSSVILPGRCSWHDVPGTQVRLLADAAISRAGVAAGLTEAYRCWDKIDHVLVCMPDHKDIDGAIRELGDLPVTYVRLIDKPRLSFTHKLPPGWATIDIDDVGRSFLEKHGTRIVTIGTGYFITRILNLADVDTSRLFTRGGDRLD